MTATMVTCVVIGYVAGVFVSAWVTFHSTGGRDDRPGALHSSD